jgi:hypothetical protein
VATVTVHGTYAGATIAFQFSDDGGTTYYSQQCSRTDTAILETGEALPTNQIRSWDCGIYATSNFEVSLTAIGSGTATVGITLSAAAIEPALTVDALQAGTWNVRAQDGSGNALTSNSTTYTAKFGLDANLLGTLGTAFTTPGFVDIKGADGNVFVRQATASNLNATVVGNKSNNGAAASSNRMATLPCVVQTDPANGSAYSQGNDAAPNCGTGGELWTSIQPALRPASYVASVKFAGSSTTDNALLPGNASNTVIVTRVIVSCTQTTAGNIALSIVKHSAADTSGTSSPMTPVPDDSTFSAAVSAPLSYTGTGPTVGTAVGNVDTYQLGCNAPATPGGNDIYMLDRRLKPIVLRGTAQQLAVNFGGAITGGNLTVTFEWEEIKTITP